MSDNQKKQSPVELCFHLDNYFLDHNVGCRSPEI